MNMIRNKLREKDGASILMGLLYLLVCMMVGTVVLTAATASAGKLAGQQESEQDYLNVASAAQLVKDRICELTYTYTYETTDTDPTPTPTETLAPNDKVILEGEVKGLCGILAESLNKNPAEDPAVLQDRLNNKAEATKPFQISRSGSTEWGIVYGRVGMKADGRIIVELWLGDEDIDQGNNHMAIEFCPDGPVKETRVEKEEDPSGGVVTSTVTTTTCSWPERGCTITKGRGEP